MQEQIANFPRTTEQAIEEWILEAVAATSEQRSRHRRHPFFRPVTISVSGTQTEKFAAFSRDISAGSIGLLHNMPLDTDQVTLTIPTILSDRTEIQMEILWCKPCGAQWYLSGGRFTTLSAGQATNLLLTTIAGELKRRLHQRHPFFRPVSITCGGVAGIRLDAFSRDISVGGIGLLHDVPLPTQHATLTIPTAAGSQIDIRTEITWSEPCGEGWYVSGSRFSSLTLEELPAMRL